MLSQDARAGVQRAKALADPTRLQIALEIRAHPHGSIDQIAERVDRHQSLVSRHCTRLYEAGLAHRNATGHPHYWLTDYGEALLVLLMSGEAHSRSNRPAISASE